MIDNENKPHNKPTNPKDGLGSDRVPMTTVSDIACAEESLAFTEGLLKYGRNNYRIMGVSASIYLDALRRHLAKFINGEDRDARTGVHHLGSVRACTSIILDAQAMGILTDDRPPKIEGFSEYIDSLEARVKYLKEMFKDRNPKHYTIQDRPV